MYQAGWSHRDVCVTPPEAAEHYTICKILIPNNNHKIPYAAALPGLPTHILQQKVHLEPAELYTQHKK
jgi:hypothetical protein